MISKELRFLVKKLALYGVNNKKISKITGISVKTVGRIKKEKINYTVDEEIYENRNLGRPSKVFKL